MVSMGTPPPPRLRRGINFGNVLDVAPGSEPGFRLTEPHIDTVVSAGFDTVRLPVRWSAHAQPEPPFAIAPAFLARVDRTVGRALARGLNVVLNIHHYHELCGAPARHSDRFIALWRQIASWFADRPSRLCFELLNEPRDPMTPGQWNALLGPTLAAVRESNQDRTVLIGPARMNDLDALPALLLPDDDHLLVTIHYYRPFPFTHQGAPWVAGAHQWLGTTWAGDPAARDAVTRDLASVADWAAARGRPLFIGEFGAYDRADLASRVRWTGWVRSEAERLGMGWAYWEFGTDFGVFEPGRGRWREPLRRALLST
jgi:endoglucanase